VVELNRAVAVGMAFGPAAGLDLVEELVAAVADDPAGAALRRSPLLPSVRADLLTKLGRADEARAEYRRAAELTTNTAQRDLLLDHAEGPVRPV
jgi:predicted RNA polymerase sigma factor